MSFWRKPKAEPVREPEVPADRRCGVIYPEPCLAEATTVRHGWKTCDAHDPTRKD